MDILIDLCRLCQTKPGITPINADFAEKIYKVTRININNNRHLPTNVCTECKTQIMAICDYIDKVNRVDHQLRNILNIQKNNLCNQTLDNNTIEIEESTNKYKCPICLKLYNNEKCFRLHMKNHSELKCSDCNIYFEDLTKKTDHNCTSKLNVDLFECEICQKKFKAKNNLRVHIKTHKLDYNCTKNECNKVFTSSYSLRIHTMYDHDGNQRYLCVSCGKKFNTKNSLNCHEKIHSDVKEYSCKLCNLNFSVRSNLRAHEKKHHEGVRFYCSKCSKTFITKCSLDRHEKTHIGIKEFACNLCPSAFYTSKELNKHKRYHAFFAGGSTVLTASFLKQLFVKKLNRNKQKMADENDNNEKMDGEPIKNEKMFTLKKWNAVAMWSWDVECDTCAICRVQVMDACLRCQAESKKDSYGKQDCVVVWGECNHSFHYCCMSLWVKQNNRCPLCQQEWSIQRMGK